MLNRLRTLFVPRTRPQAPEARVRAILKAFDIEDAVALVGVRGYYLDSLGKPGKNDRALYDDAIFLVTPEGVMRYNANTDPSVARTGVAVLEPGVHRYKLGIHGWSKPKNRRYPALVQAEPVTVNRDDWERPDTGWFGINIHRGSYRTTSSLGCQTLYPAQWDAFFSSVKDAMRRHEQRTIPYVLVKESKHNISN